jgi:hypothetical protein
MMSGFKYHCRHPLKNPGSAAVAALTFASGLEATADDSKGVKKP